MLGPLPAEPRSVRVHCAGLPFRTMTPYLRALLPTITWDVRDTTTLGAALAAVAAGPGELCYGLRPASGGRSASPRGLEVREIVTEQAWLLLPRSHVLSGRAAVRIAELAGERWFLGPDPALTASVRRAGLDAASTVDAVADEHEIEELVAAGRGVSMTSPLATPGHRTVLRPCAELPHLTWITAHQRGTLDPHIVDAVVRVAQDDYWHRAALLPRYLDSLRSRTSAAVLDIGPPDPLARATLGALRPGTGQSRIE
jgi:hypothetical protein